LLIVKLGTVEKSHQSLRLCTTSSVSLGWSQNRLEPPSEPRFQFQFSPKTCSFVSVLKPTPHYCRPSSVNALTLRHLNLTCMWNISGFRVKNESLCSLHLLTSKSICQSLDHSNKRTESICNLFISSFLKPLLKSLCHLETSGVGQYLL